MQFNGKERIAFLTDGVEATGYSYEKKKQKKHPDCYFSTYKKINSHKIISLILTLPYNIYKKIFNDQVGHRSKWKTKISKRNHRNETKLNFQHLDLAKSFLDKTQ